MDGGSGIQPRVILGLNAHRLLLQRLCALECVFLCPTQEGAVPCLLAQNLMTRAVCFPCHPFLSPVKPQTRATSARTRLPSPILTAPQRARGLQLPLAPFHPSVQDCSLVLRLERVRTEVPKEQTLSSVPEPLVRILCLALGLGLGLLQPRFMSPSELLQGGPLLYCQDPVTRQGRKQEAPAADRLETLFLLTAWDAEMHGLTHRAMLPSGEAARFKARR